VHILRFKKRLHGMDHDFEDIEVIENAVELLEDALKRKRKKWYCPEFFAHFVAAK